MRSLQKKTRDPNTGIDFRTKELYKTQHGVKMSLNKALENLKFDKRLVDLNIKQGRVTKEEVAKNDTSLPDLESQCEKLDIEKEDKDLN